MKYAKILFFVFTVAYNGMTVKAQELSINTVRKDTAALYKLTTYNTARFLRFMENTLTIKGGGYGYDVPGLTYTFTLTKNTIIQISETVSFSTTECDVPCTVLNGGWQEPSFKNTILINKERFASFDYIGKNLKTGTSGGTVLAQLGPGTHTIKIHVSMNEAAGDTFIYGYNKDMSNRTFMSLMFFEQ